MSNELELKRTELLAERAEATQNLVEVNQELEEHQTKTNLKELRKERADLVADLEQINGELRYLNIQIKQTNSPLPEINLTQVVRLVAAQVAKEGFGDQERIAKFTRRSIAAIETIKTTIKDNEHRNTKRTPSFRDNHE